MQASGRAVWKEQPTGPPQPKSRRIPTVSAAVAKTVPTIQRTSRVSRLAISVRTSAISASARRRSPCVAPCAGRRSGSRATAPGRTPPYPQVTRFPVTPNIHIARNRAQRIAVAVIDVSNVPARRLISTRLTVGGSRASNSHLGIRNSAASMSPTRSTLLPARGAFFPVLSNTTKHFTAAAGSQRSHRVYSGSGAALGRRPGRALGLATSGPSNQNRPR